MAERRDDRTRGEGGSPAAGWHLPTMSDSLSDAAGDLQGRVDQIAEVLDDYERRSRGESERSAAALVEHAMANRDARIDEARRAAAAAAAQLSAFDRRLRDLDERLGTLPDTGALVQRVNQRMAAAFETRDRKLGEAYGTATTAAERIASLTDELHALQTRSARSRTAEPGPDDRAASAAQLDELRGSMAATVDRLEKLERQVRTLAQRPAPTPADADRTVERAAARAAAATSREDAEKRVRRTNAVITEALRARDQRIRMVQTALERADARFREVDERIRALTGEIGRTREEQMRIVDERLASMTPAASTEPDVTEQLLARLRETAARIQQGSTRLDAIDRRVTDVDERVRAIPAVDALLNRVKSVIAEAMHGRDDRMRVTVEEAARATNERMDQLDGTLVRAEDRLRTVDERLEAIGGATGPLGDRIDGIDDSLGAMDRRLNDLGRRIEARPDASSVVRLTTEAIGDVLKARNAALDDVRASVSSTVERLEALDGRAATSDRRIAALTQRLAATANEDGRQERIAAEVEQALTARDERIADVLSTLTDLTRRLGAVEHRLTRPDADLSSVTRRTDETVSAAVTPLVEQLEGLSARVAGFEQRDEALRRAIRQSRMRPAPAPAVGAGAPVAAGPTVPDLELVEQRLREAVAARDTQLDEVRRGLEAVDGRVAALTNRVDAAGESDQSEREIERALLAIGGRLDALSGRLDTTDRVATGADERFIDAERRLGAIADRVEAVFPRLDEVGERLDGLPNPAEVLTEALATRDAQMDELRVALAGSRQEVGLMSERVEQLATDAASAAELAASVSASAEETLTTEAVTEAIDEAVTEAVDAAARETLTKVQVALAQRDATLRDVRRAVDAAEPRLDVLDERMAQLATTVVARADASVTEALATREAHFEKMRSAIAATAEWLNQIDRRIGELPDVEAAVSAALADRDARYEELTTTVADALANRDLQVQDLAEDVAAANRQLEAIRLRSASLP